MGGAQTQECARATALHLDFIRASEEEAEARSSAQRNKLEAMAAAKPSGDGPASSREAQRNGRRWRGSEILRSCVSILAAMQYGWAGGAETATKGSGRAERTS